jgi:hypothetical protein
MLHRGYRGDGSAFARLLGRPPLPFAPERFFTDSLPAAAGEGA